MNSQTELFFKFLFQNVENGYIEIRIIKDNDIKETEFFHVSEISEIDEYIEDNKERGHIYFGVAPRDNDSSGTEEDVSKVAALWADIDGKDFEDERDIDKRIDNFPIEPTITVSSGNGRHLYWLLKEDQEIESPKNILKRIEKQLNGDSVSDLSRLMRVPETYNMKHPEYYNENSEFYQCDTDDKEMWKKCTIESSTGNQYDVETFNEKLPELTTGDKNSTSSTLTAELTEIKEEVLGQKCEIENLQDLKERVPDFVLERAKNAPDDFENDRSRNDFKVAIDMLQYGLNEMECITAFGMFRRNGWYAGDKLAEKKKRDKGKDYILRTVRKANNNLNDEDKCTNDTYDMGSSPSTKPNYMKHTPVTINDEVYQKLPSMLKPVFNNIEGKRKRDMVLTAMMPVISALSPNTVVSYSGELTFLNVYTTVVGHSGSGKGICASAKKLGQKVEKKLTDNNQGNDMLFIPGDNTAAGLKELLSENPQGIIFETEIETLTTAIESDFGSFEHIIKKNFQNENVHVHRKTDGTLKIDEPRFSVFLSGIFGDLTPIMESYKDGLFQRFLFYFNKKELKYESQLRGSKGIWKQEINKLQERFKELYEILTNREVALEVSLPDKHIDLIDNAGDQVFEWMKNDGFEREITAQVLRVSLVATRISCLSAVVRTFQNDREKIKDNEKITTCDEDVEIGLWLSYTLLSHNLYVIDSKMAMCLGLSDEKFDFRSRLPKEFGRSDVKNLADPFDRTERTMERWLEDLLEFDYVERIDRGEYRKTDKEEKKASHVVSVVKDVIDVWKGDKIL